MACSAARFLCSPSIRDRARPVGLVGAAITIGAVAWGSDPRTLPLALLLPSLWASARSRTTAAGVAAGYFLAASRGLPRGVATFFSTSLVDGLALWFGAALVFTVVYAGFWTRPSGAGRALRWTMATILMAVPPLGIVGWAGPITAAGMVFPGWGWAGVVATLVLMFAQTIDRSRRPAFAVLAGLAVWGAATWSPSASPPGWIGLDLAWGRALGRDMGLEAHGRLIDETLGTVRDGTKVVVLPENALGVLTPTVAALWVDRLRGSGMTVLAGATDVHHEGWDNVLVAIDGAGAEVVYQQRVPVPLAMWQPWRSLVGEKTGAGARLVGSATATVGDRRVAPFVCYEELLVWPVLDALLHEPDIIVVVGNGWWTTGTDIIGIQKSVMSSWARLFGVRVAFAFNA